MFFHSLRGEITKLTSTKSFYWCTGMVLVLSWFIGYMVGKSFKDELRGNPVLALFADHQQIADQAITLATSFVQQLCILILSIMIVLMVTGEFRYHTMRTTAVILPKRIHTVFAKFLLGLVVMLVASILAGFGMVICIKLGGGVYMDKLDVFSHAIFKFYGQLLVMACGFTLYSLGLAFLLRSSVGSIALLLLWMNAEGLIRILPKIGSHIYGYFPFANLNAWLTESDLENVSWGWNISLWYWMGWMVLLFVAGAILHTRRDV